MGFYNEVRSILEGVDMTGGRHEQYEPISPDFELLPKEIDYIDTFSQLYLNEFEKDWNVLQAGWVPKAIKATKYGVADVSVEGQFSTTGVSIIDRIVKRIHASFNQQEKKVQSLLDQKSTEGNFQRMMLFAREKTFRNIQFRYDFEYEEYVFAFGAMGVNSRGQGYSFKGLSIPYSFGWFEVDKFPKRARSLFAAWLHTLLYDPHGYNLVWNSNVLAEYKKDREVHTLVSRDTDETFGRLMDEL